MFRQKIIPDLYVLFYKAVHQEDNGFHNVSEISVFVELFHLY